MGLNGGDFLRRKFLHLFSCFDHGGKGFIERQDAELQNKKLLEVVRRQLQEKELHNEEIEERVEEFTASWMPGAMKYFFHMSQFAKDGGQEKITKDDFISFKMSIRDHILTHGELPSWFDESLRASFPQCWSSDSGLLEEEGLELLPGVENSTKSVCHHLMTDNNNKKIGLSEFIDLIKGYYSIDDPEHVSKYIHGYQEN